MTTRQEAGIALAIGILCAPILVVGLGVLRLCDVLSEAWWDWKHGTALDSERLRRYERKDGGL